MGYQALLFCPDEKTARTVSQVLGELDFAVVPCTEPFAAVKKLMAEHFDAIVVDCDNEQNATLLFKSAHNTVHNQSSLAVAVVEGQAGVAKAFRIGANLVLTKPINVEQAKGTLRVARGLLRKNEAAKPATGLANTTVKPLAAPEILKTASHPQVPSSSAPQLVPALTPALKIAAQPQLVGSSAGRDEDDLDLFDVREEIRASSKPAPVAASASPKTTPTVSMTEPKTVEVGSKPAPLIGLRAGAASAPAPAREPQAAPSIEQTASATIEIKTTAPLSEAGKSSGTTASADAQFSFGGNVDDKPASGGSKKAIVAVAAVVLVAAAYGTWMKFGHPSDNVATPVHVSSPANSLPIPVPNTAASTSGSSTPGLVPSPATESMSLAKASPATKTISDTKTTSSSDNSQTRSGKTADADTTKISREPTNKVEVKEDATPIVMKSIAKKPDPGTSTLADASAPNLSAIAPTQNATLPNLMGSQSRATAPVLQTMSISQGVSQGLLVHKVQPPYPQNALAMHIEGPVQLLATISKTGDITFVKILSGEPQLARAAAEAVKQWKYKPYLLNGSPVEIQTQVTINFKLPH